MYDRCQERVRGTGRGPLGAPHLCPGLLEDGGHGKSGGSEVPQQRSGSHSARRCLWACGLVLMGQPCWTEPLRQNTNHTDSIPDMVPGTYQCVHRSQNMSPRAHNGCGKNRWALKEDGWGYVTLSRLCWRQFQPQGNHRNREGLEGLRATERLV